jgi:hypothetical protein
MKRELSNKYGRIDPKMMINPIRLPSIGRSTNFNPRSQSIDPNARMASK